jgi:hypothetical protein
MVAHIRHSGTLLFESAQWSQALVETVCQIQKSIVSKTARKYAWSAYFLAFPNDYVA